MRLELLSKKKILEEFTDDLTGSLFDVNHTTFKYTVAAGPLYINKVDLTSLFNGIPQSVVGIEFGDVVQELALEAPEWVSESFPDSVPAMDTLGVHFCNWKRLAGLYDLSREEVELSQMEEFLIIEAKRAMLYRGLVAVKIQ